MSASNDESSLGFFVWGCTLLEQITIQRRCAVFNRIPPIVSTALSVTAMLGTTFQVRHEKFNLQEIILSQRTIDVVDHPLGATPQQVTKLLFLVFFNDVFVIATLTILVRIQANKPLNKNRPRQPPPQGHSALWWICWFYYPGTHKCEFTLTTIHSGICDSIVPCII